MSYRGLKGVANLRLIIAVMLLLAFFLLATSALSAQVAPNPGEGLTPYAGFDASSIDAVSLSSGNLNLNIPLLSYPQRGDALKLSFSVSYNNRAWQLYRTYDSTGHQISAQWLWKGRGVGIVHDQAVGYLHRLTRRYDGINTKWVLVHHYFAVEANGTSHQLNSQIFSLPGRSVDATSYYTPGSGQIVTPDGTLFQKDANGYYYSQDSNGNQIRTSAQGWTDSIGRLIPGNTTVPFSPLQTVGGEQPVYFDAETIYPGIPTIDLSSCPAGTSAARNWVVPAPMASSAPYTLCYTTQNVSTSFNMTGVQEGSYTATLLTSIVLPGGDKWSFSYDAQGNLARVTLPTGGYINYQWQPDCAFGACTGMRVSTRTIFDGTTSVSTRYQYGVTVNSESGTLVTDADGNDTFHRFYLRSYVDKVYEYQGAYTGGNLLRTSTTTYHSDTGFTLMAISGGSSDMNVVPIERTTQLSGGGLSRTTYDYDNDQRFLYDDPVSGTTYTYPIYFGSVLAKTEYNFDGSWRKTATDYKWRSDVNFKTANLVRLAERETITSSSCSGSCAQTTYLYSNTVNSTGISTQHVAVTGTRGNLSQVQRWRNLPTAGTLTTSYVVNDTGTIASENDPRSQTTTYEYSTTYAGAYQTKTTLPQTGAVAHSVSAAYDWNSGLITSFTDQNGQVTSYQYDVRFRPTQVQKNSTGQLKTWEYLDSTTIRARASIDSSNSIENISTFDGLGRPKQTRLTSDPDGATFIDKTYDSNGRLATVSNPYRSTGDLTYGITTTSYDALDRVTKVVPPDGTSSSNNVSTVYSGDCSTVTDQAGRKRTRCPDAYGRLVSVSEDPSGLNYLTKYFYDDLDNLICVEQHGNAAGTGCSSPASSDPSSPWRVRRFAYDSLSRLLTATNPESGSILYFFTDIGGAPCAGELSLPCRRQDARGVITTYAYDALDRLVTKTYSDSTLSAAYGYDSYVAGSNYGIGRRTSMSVGASGNSVAWTYDAGGRVTKIDRTVDAISKSVSYGYNQDDSAAWIRYPSGRTVTYAEGKAGRYLSAIDSANVINYVTQASYAPFGSVTSLRNGEKAGYAGTTITNVYNKRLQPTLLSAASPTLTVFSLSYDWSLGVSDNGNVTAIQNNRDNPGRPVGSVQFTYDSLNRLATAQTIGTDCSVMQNGLSANWGNSFGYDPWGNLLSKTVTKCSSESLSSSVNYNNQLGGYSYDPSGNLQQAGYAYDAENRLTLAAGVTFTYDGDGTRVKKSSGKLYWTGLDGGVLSESNLSGAISKEYVYFNGKRSAFLDVATGLPYFYFSDHLGSASVITSGDGKAIKEESDYYPFGGERVIVDQLANQYKFTGKERDTETGLDYLGARYYGSNMGRFTSPDEFTGGPVDAFGSDPTPPGPLPYADITNPQSLNKYSYTYNNPLNMTDPDGHCPTVWECVVGGVATVGQGITWAWSSAAAGAGALVVLTAEMIKDPTGSNFANAPRGGMGVMNADGMLEEAHDPAQQPSNSAHGQSTPGDPNDQKPYQNTPENKDRMQQGKAPVGKDGKPVELHHDGQSANGKLKEMTQSQHRGGDNFKKNHPNTGQQPSQIDRNKFKQQRQKYWKDKANQS